MNNTRRKQIAQETLLILEQGYYIAPSGQRVFLVSELLECMNHTCCYTPEQLTIMQKQTQEQPPPLVRTDLEVTGETTLQASARLANSGAFQRIGVLNFASAKNPGGGFLGGAQAQEESLARCSGLYKSLLACGSHYEFHRSYPSRLYTDRMIYSPGCPIFRTDDGTLLEQPYFVDFISSAAPNAGAVQRNEPHQLGQVRLELQNRSSKTLSLAAQYQCDALVLGAWGCGVFQNDPRVVAEVFFGHLGPGNAFDGWFRTVVMAIFDTSPGQKTYTAFTAQFPELDGSIKEPYD